MKMKRQNTKELAWPLPPCQREESPPFPGKPCGGGGGTAIDPRVGAGGSRSAVPPPGWIAGSAGRPQAPSPEGKGRLKLGKMELDNSGEKTRKTPFKVGKLTCRVAWLWVAEIDMAQCGLDPWIESGCWGRIQWGLVSDTSCVLLYDRHSDTVNETNAYFRFL
jgi:hypothetical protein